MSNIFDNIFNKKEEDDSEIKIVNGEIVGEDKIKIDEEKINDWNLEESKYQENTVYNLEKDDNNKDYQESKVESNNGLELEKNRVQNGKDGHQDEYKSEDSTKGRIKNLDGFFLMLKAAGRSKNTIAGYRSDLRFWRKIAEKKRKSIYKLKYQLALQVMKT